MPKMHTSISQSWKKVAICFLEKSFGNFLDVRCWQPSVTGHQVITGRHKLCPTGHRDPSWHSFWSTTTSLTFQPPSPESTHTPTT